MEHKIWLEQPACCWEEAFPVGNGSLGGMVFGKTGTERIALNIDELWSGNGKSKNQGKPKEVLPKVREKMRQGKCQEAEEILQKDFLCDWSESYLPLGDLMIQYEKEEKIFKYRRELDLRQAIAFSTFQNENNCIKEEVYVSYPDKILVCKIRMSEARDLKVWLESPLMHERKSTSDACFLYGNAPSRVYPNYYDCDEPVLYDKENPGMGYCVGVIAGRESSCVIEEDKLCFYGVKEVVLYLYASTAYDKKTASIAKGIDEVREETRLYLQKISEKKENEIRKEHLQNHKKLYERCELNLYGTKSEHPTEQSIEKFSKQKEKGLVELMFHFGRYLLICSSREGTMAANLQGIWNDKIRAPWSSNYTTNINLQMNYWAAEKTNLSELHMPLFDLLENCVPTGSRVAEELFGCSGWVINHNVDAWMYAAPVGKLAKKPSAKYGFYPAASGWLCLHIWEHYLYTSDKKFLEKYYSVMKGACDFYLDYIQEEDGIKIYPSTSPENLYYDKEKNQCALSVNTTMDCAVIRCLFMAMIHTAEILEKDSLYVKKLCAVIEKIPGYQINATGQLQEWSEDYEEVYPVHRHISHLFGLYPGRDYKMTERYYDACKKTLEHRTMEGTAWSKVWKTCIYARIRDGEAAYEQLAGMFHLRTGNRIEYETSGCYRNLFTAEPLQIDGNLGFTAAVAEMLIRDDEECIELLPALPKAWDKGKITGIKIIGGHTISFSWKNHKVDSIILETNGVFVKNIKINGKLTKINLGECQKTNIMIEK